MKTAYTLRIKQLFTLVLLVIVSQFAADAQTIVSSSDVALNKVGTASSIQTDKVVKNAFDGNLSTRFSSLYSDSEWISVDLGQMYLISQVVLIWERAYGKDFNILVSRNGSFTDLISDSIQIRNNVLGTDSVAGTNTIKMKSNTVARYVRMQGIHRATVFGYSLFEFQVAGAASVSSLLPATLTGFTATTQGNTSLLEWTTTTEYNTAGFSIERSNDGANFTAIGWVNGTNGGTVTTHYSYTDKQASNGRNYYRLKVTDLGGSDAYSAAVTAITSGNATTKAYPVPVIDHIVIEYSAAARENVNISLYNSGGQVVYNDKITAQGGSQKMTISRTPGMLPGIYFLTISTTGNGQYSEKIILQ
jgi:hypothetical protein